MKPKGDIFKAGKSPLKGEILIALPLALRVFYHIFRLIGTSLLTVAIVGVIFSYGPVIKDEFKYYFSGVKKTQSQEQLIKIAEAERTFSVQRETDYLGIDSSFSIAIPKIDAISNVVANVDPSNEESYAEALKVGVAHARGTYFPGQGENIFLFSHSTDSPLNIVQYNAIFYLLRKLEKGDKIVVYFSDDKYIYEVDYTVITGASDTQWINQKAGQERLVLQTCDPPGTTKNRLLVIAKPVVGN